MTAFTGYRGSNKGRIYGRHCRGRLLHPRMDRVCRHVRAYRYVRDSLSARMNVYREVWMRRLLDRDAPMVDMQIVAAVQNGTAFFASTSMIARHPDEEIVRSRGPAFQSRPARVLLCAGLSRLVRQSPGLVRDDGGGRDRHLAQAIRLQCVARWRARTRRMVRRSVSGLATRSCAIQKMARDRTQNRPPLLLIAR